jgi:hypothetical protein
MEQIMEFLKANKAELEAVRKADKEESMAKMERLLANNREMKADKEEMMATIRSGQKEMIKAITGASQESMEACEEKAEMAINSIYSELEGKINARMEYAVAVADKQTQALHEELNQKVEEAERCVQASIDTRTENFQDDITSTGTKDRTGEQRLAMRRHRQRKKWAQVNGGPRQKFAAFRGRFTRRAIHVMRKGHVRRGPGKRCHRNGVRRPGRTCGTRIVKRDRQPAVGYRSPLKRRTKVTVVQGAPEGRTDDKQRQTRPECMSRASGNRREGRTEKRDQCLEAKMMHLEIIRRNLCWAILRLMIMSFIGLQEPGNRTQWKCRPPPKRKR